MQRCLRLNWLSSWTPPLWIVIERTIGFSSWTPPLWIVIERTISYLIVSLTTTYIFQGKHFVNIIFASATGLLLLLEKRRNCNILYRRILAEN